MPNFFANIFGVTSLTIFLLPFPLLVKSIAAFFKHNTLDKSRHRRYNDMKMHLFLQLHDDRICVLVSLLEEHTPPFQIYSYFFNFFVDLIENYIEESKRESKPPAPITDVSSQVPFSYHLVSAVIYSLCKILTIQTG